MAQDLVFKVQRRSIQLIGPAEPTPHEYKRLSDIDDQEGLQFHVRLVFFYRPEPRMEGKDPVQVIRSGLARALVPYYPFAGRLREWEERKLVVDCTGEGVMFIEADADVRLEQFGDGLQPPFPCMDELLYDVPGSGGILNSPLLLIQVTRLRCGGFVFGLRFNHTMCDGFGIYQFINAVAEMAGGASSPSVTPVWQRELLDARDPPQVIFSHREYEKVARTVPDEGAGTDDMVHRSFFFGKDEVAAIRNSVPHHLRSCSTVFELIVACLWRCRTIALRPNPDEDMRFLTLVNARSRFNPPLPTGYYGNAFAFPAAVARAGKLCRNPLGYALELVRKVKMLMNEEYLQSVADLMVAKRRSGFGPIGSFLVSHLTRAGFDKVDFGWGKPVYGGTAGGAEGPLPGTITFYLRGRNPQGEEGIVVPICLPAPVMERFEQALENVLQGREAVRAPKTPQVSASL
ncbi:hypothetical protein SAY87_013847 [Trapa incisa]|uniref:Benzyl alcohol O-benzoyltransferase n=1 Tax=Trapa incisa TaxID=236973 RepID=A0AAN7KC57_9MYRT|nr:hypothetical protein SAY87_013847 [Trapa incisa]